MKSIFTLFCIAALALTIVGCKAPSNYVVLASNTTLGFDVSEAAATSTPQATLAYKRQELALIPCTTNGVVPDVLMDFEFKTAIFTSNGGIRSRIATGEHATTQQPASLMMANRPGSSFISTLFPPVNTKTNK
jgi:hypothetical protein